MAAVIRKKAKAKHQRMKKEAKNKQYPKRSKKLLIAPKSLPNREELQEQVHKTSELVNKVLRPILTSAPLKDEGNYDTQLDHLREQILEQHRANIAAAQSTYEELIEALDKADAVLEILDVRDPVSCQFLNAEGEVHNKGKPLILVLNKIDLVPREVVTHWIAYYSGDVPVVAISSLDAEHSKNALASLISSVAPAAKAIAVIGGRHVGKTHICEFNPNLFHEVSSYAFIQRTESACLLDLTDWIDPPRDLAVATVARSNGENVFSVLGVPPTEDPEDVIVAYSKKWGIKQKQASLNMIQQMQTGQIHWYAAPDEANASNISQEQAAALEASTPYEMLGFEFMTLNKGDPLEVDDQLMGIDEDNEEEEENAEEQQ